MKNLADRIMACILNTTQHLAHLLDGLLYTAALKECYLLGAKHPENKECFWLVVNDLLKVLMSIPGNNKFLMCPL